MSIRSFFGDDELADAKPRATIAMIANGFILDGDANGRGLDAATAHATPESLAAAVQAWAVNALKPKAKATPKPARKTKPTKA